MSGEFYKNGYGGRRGEKPHRSLLMWLLDLVMTLLTVVVGATMAVTYFVPYVNPAGVWFLPLLGLAAPAIFVATVILALSAGGSSAAERYWRWSSSASSRFRSSISPNSAAATARRATTAGLSRS